MSYDTDLALPECLTLWRELALCGAGRTKADKRATVVRLYEQGKLSQPSYTASCPFCEAWNCYSANGACENCLWPGYSSVRCERGPWSLYRTWLDAPDAKARRAAANAIYQMLKNL